jgi:ABC-type phosphate transport system ATPase subunit
VRQSRQPCFLLDAPCLALDPIATRKIEELMLELKTR